MTDNFFMKFPSAPGEGTTAYPGGWTVIAGAPHVQAFRHYTAADGSATSGLWTCTPGTFDVVYENWEFCHMLSGRCLITPNGAAPIELRTGNAFILEPGFRGKWQVLETMSKHFVFKITAKA